MSLNLIFLFIGAALLAGGSAAACVDPDRFFEFSLSGLDGSGNGRVCSVGAVSVAANNSEE